jgi:hypothetical protein
VADVGRQLEQRRERQPLSSGVNEGRAGEPLDDMQVLEILEVFGIEGLRSYIMGHMEGVAEAAVESEEE